MPYAPQGASPILVRPAMPDDLPAMSAIYAAARRWMRSRGNVHQWVNGYPSDELLLTDIRAQRSFVCTTGDGQVVGAFCLLGGIEPTYQRLYDGTWPNDLPYVTIHRLASDGRVRGIFRACLSFARSKSAVVRADTHKDNLKMQQLLVQNGFQRCGIIYLEDQSQRIAYQLG
ncbi:GNAT family protein [uncultured Alloprevotella sp.]|uniref:GNAT family N-acetyltransferase n=1 Tax=uncultured Alloprevotella sp. TaxID=1283315 RepID=UPI00262A65F6|nr:GNAT family protein [uncultured Alloprevotella sp.]